jgi:hypothetical protein
MATKKTTAPKPDERVAQLMSTLTKYQSGKAVYDQRYIDNDVWYRSQHWDLFRTPTSDKTEPEPTSAYLWSTLANRHGDLMDAFPEPVMVEREASDKVEADVLSKVTKFVLDRNKFRKTYSDNAWYKVKSGTACYHVLWDQKLEGGLGDIAVRKVDLLRLYWEPGIDNIQDSPYLFALSLMPLEAIKRKYKELNDLNLKSAIDLKSYMASEKPDLETKAVVIDCYYIDEQQHTQMDRIIGGQIIESTADSERRWLYRHGKYPFVFDTMFPEEHSLLGFGLVDVIKSPQMYIDKLDQILTRNALIAGRYRLLYKEGAIDANLLADVSQDFIPCTGNLKEGDDYAVLQADALPSTIMEHRTRKIQELKEVSGSNDANRGEGGNGITAASAILALQEAGNKLARAMVASTYDAYTEICVQIIELISEFYDDARKFRITNDQGEVEYIQYDNSGLQPQPMAPAASGAKPEERKPIFDVTPRAEKYTPFASLAQNEMAKELFAAGFFSPEMAPAALIAFEMMSFDGKDRIVKLVKESYDKAMGIQQMQAEAGQNQDMLVQMNELIQEATGQDMLAGTTVGQAPTDPAAMQQGVMPQ